MAPKPTDPMHSALRIGQAAEILGVSIDTLRRWSETGRIRVRRSRGGQRTISLAELQRLRAARTRVERDRVAAVVEVQAGPHRLVSLMTAEAAGELALRAGQPVVCVVKATNVVVEIARSTRGA